MKSDKRWDAEMLAARERQDAFAATLPPQVMAHPFDEARAINDQVAALWSAGGPAMAESREFSLRLRGRLVACRLHRPRADAALPLLVWAHGGGWVFSSIDTHDRLARELAVAGDVAVLLVDYALAPEARFPVALYEMDALLRRVGDEAAGWAVDGARVLVGGDSAGGNLALAAAMLARDTGGPKLAGVLAAYPVTDADFASPTYLEFAEGYGLTASGMKAFWELYLGHEADRFNPLAAPLRGEAAGLPPVFMPLAEIDVLRSEGERMAEKIRAAGGVCEAPVYRGMSHGFMRMTGAVTGARRALDEAGLWLRAVTGRG
jgi:acetyl esterase